MEDKSTNKKYGITFMLIMELKYLVYRVKYTKYQ